MISFLYYLLCLKRGGGRMETGHEVVATVVGFVVVLDADMSDLENGTQCLFENPKAAFEFSNAKQDGWFCKLLMLPSGETTLDLGFHDGESLGNSMYGLPCTGCKKQTWWSKHYPTGTHCFCDVCSEKNCQE